MPSPSLSPVSPHNQKTERSGQWAGATALDLVSICGLPWLPQYSCPHEKLLFPKNSSSLDTPLYIFYPLRVSAACTRGGGRERQKVPGPLPPASTSSSAWSSSSAPIAPARQRDFSQREEQDGRTSGENETWLTSLLRHT